MPRSWIRPWAQSASQPEKLTLNLRGICWLSGLRRKCATAPSRCAVTSVCSRGQTPASGQAVMLRMVLPQASRVVTPSSARRRSTAPVSASGT
jgi:hypothetical protein